jgi:two-component system, OmpR family, sensor histidine kinase BaeS
VKCYLEAIEDGMMTLDSRTITLLQKELTRLTDITEQIMQYEHLTHHSTEDIQIERFAIGRRIAPLIHEYLPQLEKNKQQILLIPTHDVFVRMDSDMCIQILHNVFSNFVKYAGKGATLSCSYAKSPTTVQIIFSDDGAGIPEDEIALVREKFYRVDKSRTRDTQVSMGIGLSIIDHIVRIHDGHLDIANVEPHGLMISIVIPR